VKEEQMIRYLHLAMDIPEDELRTLREEQLADSMATIQDGQDGLLTVPEVRDRLKANGLFDLPAFVERQRRDVNEFLDANVRAMADRHVVDQAKEEGPYPPPRLN
jgi:hypothetical protein